ncbi:MAG: hypothetical protein ACPG8W_12415 [Candidatus Promineifilaceae bacterium]
MSDVKHEMFVDRINVLVQKLNNLLEANHVSTKASQATKEMPEDEITTTIHNLVKHFDDFLKQHLYMEISGDPDKMQKLRGQVNQLSRNWHNRNI